jgi:membrane protein insertase Oxa1/YidC/SpoIIIJ
MQMYAPQIADYQRRIVDVKARGDQTELQSLAMEFHAFMKSKGIPHPFTFIRNVLVQMPVYLGSFFAIRRLARDAHLIPGLNDGIPSWLPGLHLPDPTFILPAVSLALSWIAIWTNPNAMGIPAAELSPAGQRLLFSTLGGVFFFVGAKMPAVSNLLFYYYYSFVFFLGVPCM